MAAGAGALNVCVGGDETYHGTLQRRSVLGPPLADNTRPSAAGLQDACRLVNRSIALWLIVIGLFEFFCQVVRMKFYPLQFQLEGAPFASSSVVGRGLR